MELPSILLATVAVAGVSGGAAAWFSRGRGKETISLLQTNVDAFKDSEKLKDQRIAYLEGQLITKDETIKRLLHDGKKKR